MNISSVLKKIILLWLCCFPVASFAQIESATIGVNGLTCSQCSRSVEMALKKLPFVLKVDMNLAQTIGTVYFKKGENVNLDKLAQAPRDAGFSTRFVKLKLNLSELNQGENCFVVQGKVFYFLQPLAARHSPTGDFQVIAKGFLPKKELRNYDLKTNGPCTASEKYYLKSVKG